MATLAERDAFWQGLSHLETRLRQPLEPHVVVEGRGFEAQQTSAGRMQIYNAAAGTAVNGTLRSDSNLLQRHLL